MRRSKYRKIPYGKGWFCYLNLHDYPLSIRGYPCFCLACGKQHPATINTITGRRAGGRQR